MEVVAGGLSAATACLFTNPMEVVKNRLQVQGELLSRGEYVKLYRGPVHGLVMMARTDGVLSLQAGLGPAMLYQVRAAFISLLGEGFCVIHVFCSLGIY